MSTYTVTPEQREKIELAIAKAKGPGACSYVAGCVAGQLARIEGVSKERLEAWDERRDSNAISALIEEGVVPELARYDIVLIRLLQRTWDRIGGPVTGCRRALLSHFHELIGATTDA